VASGAIEASEVSGAAAPRSPVVFFERKKMTFHDPDHHLWRNGRLYWVAFTVHLPGWQKERVRLSLGTDDLHEARRRRDEVLSEYPRRRSCTLSLRSAQRRPAPAAA
jgi:hypothetical protein